MFAILHSNFDWVLPGIVGFIGLMMFLIKTYRFEWGKAMVSAMVWLFVYKVHSGSTQGIMTATLIALLFDIFGMPLLHLFRRR